MSKGLRVGFIGPPCSGKTTTAARLFSQLKDSGIPTEFVPEQARIKIAEAKFNGELKLNDEFQWNIAITQRCAEEYMVYSCTDGVVVTDSCSLNSFLYMTESMREKIFLSLKEAVDEYDLLFYCPPVPEFVIRDPNRVHSREESIKIDAEIPHVLDRFGIRGKVIPLYGDSNLRLSDAMREVLELYKSCR